VVVGLPGKPPLLRNFALIGTPFYWRESLSGRLAVLGPARMHYDRLMRAVGYIGRLL
jgi:transcriptional regulator of heat shock response